MINIIPARFNGATSVVTEDRFQYDYGQRLLISGIALPSSYEVHFSNLSKGGEASIEIGNSSGVDVPDALFLTGKPIYAWIVLHEGNADGKTAYSIKIPVKERSFPADVEYPEVDRNLITQAISELNSAKNQVLNSIDDTLSVSGKSADANAVGVYLMLFCDDVPNTIAEITKDIDNQVTGVVHKRGSSVIRTDTYNFGENAITETRSLSTGETLTKVTNLSTLDTTITYTGST